MKTIKIVIGIAAGLYAAFGIVQFIYAISTADAGNAYGFASITAALAVPCIGAAISLGCLQSAFARPKPKPEQEEEALEQ